MTEPSYFEMSDAESATGGRFVTVSEDVQGIEFLPGLVFNPVVGEKVMVNFVRFEPHTEAPLHVHDEEQISVVLEGEFEFDLNGDRRIVRPGQAVVIPPRVPHGARTLDSSCYEIDVFVPPRQALLRLLEQQE